jgi:hypothetical protein
MCGGENCDELNMAMVSFVSLFPEVANKETRRVGLAPQEGLAPTNDLPNDWYFFEELYCDEPGCDCRRVMVNVIAASTGQHLATINHAFEPRDHGALVTAQTFLDPLKSQFAVNLMDLFLHVIRWDEPYRQRLMRHYQMFKGAIDDPSQLAGAKLKHLPIKPGDTGSKSRVIPPPPRHGRRKWR